MKRLQWEFLLDFEEDDEAASSDDDDESTDEDYEFGDVATNPDSNAEDV